MSPLANARLVTYGLLIGLISALYPRLYQFLPPSAISYLPFSSNSPLSASYSWSNYQKYQSKIPIAANHDPSDVRGPTEEKMWRLSSKDGEKERAKMINKEREMMEKRTETAGFENAVGVGGSPVYFIETPGSSSDSLPSSWLFGALPEIGREIMDEIRPRLIVFIRENLDASDFHIDGSLSSSVAIPSIIEEHLAAFVDSDEHGAKQTARSIAVLPQNHLLLNTMFESIDSFDVVQVELPGSPMTAWSGDDWEHLGTTLRPFREQGVVFVVHANATPRNPPPRFSDLLHSVLHDYTGHPRLATLASLHSGTLGKKPDKMAVNYFAGIYLALGIAGSGEGVKLFQKDEDYKQYWRFGDLPIRRAYHRKVLYSSSN